MELDRVINRRALPAFVLLGAFHLAACGGGGSDASGAAGAGGTSAGGSSGSAGASGTTGAAGVGGVAGVAGEPGSAGAAGGAAGATGGAGTAGGAAGAVAGRGGAGSAGSRGGAGGVGGSAGMAVAGRGGASGSGATAGAMGDAGTDFLPCPTTAGAACAVMPLGDSITEGYPGLTGSFRAELFRQAVTNGKSLTFVGTLMNGPTTVASRTFPQRHEGHRGYTIDTGGSNSGISGQVVDQAIAGQHPQIVVLMIGTNDVNRNVDLANAPTRLGKLLDEIVTDAPSALVVVTTIIPIADNTINAQVQAYNAAIPALVSARAAAGKHVVFLDTYAAFVKDASYRTTLMADTLHPNDAGYVVLGKALYGAISALLPPGP